MVYELWLLPNGYIDEALSKNIASISTGILTSLGEEMFITTGWSVLLEQPAAKL